MAAATQAILTGIIGAIRQPETDDVGVDRLSNLDTFEHMRDRLLPNLLVDMAQTAKTIGIFLKEVRIDSTNTQAKCMRILFHRLPIVFHVPGNMNGDARTDARDVVDLCRVCQLLTQITGRPRPVKHLEARPRVAIPPGWRFDGELLNFLYDRVYIHVLLLLTLVHLSHQGDVPP